MADGILILNCGSSSIKFAVYDAGALEPIVRGQIEDIGEDPRIKLKAGDVPGLPKVPFGAEARHEELIAWLLAQLDARLADITIVAAGHRVVHGGLRHEGAAILIGEEIDYLATLRDLAPNHQPHNLAGIEAVRSVWPNLKQSATFDTAFHRTQPRLSQMFALPRRMTDDGIVKFGFHGLSYTYIASVLSEIAGSAASGKVIVCHLGHGASLCAMDNCRSVATTMGFTALPGLVMGKRSGDLDPGLVLHLIRHHGMSADEVSDLLRKKSGLLGVSGETSDMRDLLELDTPEAREAVDLFVFRCQQKIGEMAASAGGMDALVFTAGIGENSPIIRRRICERLDWMGVALDDDANNGNAEKISADTARVPVFVIKTNEELVIARDAASLLL